MKTIKLSKKSFWFKVVNLLTYYPDESEQPRDTCSMRWLLIWTGVFTLLSLPLFIFMHLVMRLLSADKRMTGTGVQVVNITVQALGSIVFSTITSPLIAITLGPIVFMIGFMIVTGLVLWAVIAHSNRQMRKMQEADDEEEKPCFITELYRSAKDKLCSKIEYID